LKRVRQTAEEILAALTLVESSWRDAHSDEVIRVIESIPDRDVYGVEDVARILDSGFRAGLTTLQLILGLSKDEFKGALRSQLSGAIGSKRYKADRDAFLAVLVSMGAGVALGALGSRPITWRDLLVERLKGGRGSAIKGQVRGRALEDFTETILKAVFGPRGYHTRCRFVGRDGVATEKADFAIPSKADPQILIEVKAYGATGSKQTDVLGDVERIGAQKRNDTHLLVVTDGTTWMDRQNDLRKLVAMQNDGRIARIYTRSMAAALEADLADLRDSLKIVTP
jgi:hypothetical protein